MLQEIQVSWVCENWQTGSENLYKSFNDTHSKRRVYNLKKKAKKIHVYKLNFVKKP